MSGEAVVPSQYRELSRLLIDVAALQTDPVGQRQQLIDGLQKLLATKLGWLFVVDNYRPGRQAIVTHQILTGDMNPAWLGYITDFVTKFPPEADLYARCMLECDDSVQVRTRYEMFIDAATEAKYADMIAMIRLLELGDSIVAAYRSGPNGDRVTGFSLHRDEKMPNLSRDDVALAWMAIEEMAEMDRRGYLVFREPTELDLAPRLHQVLDRLLSGKAPKQIAGELHLSVHTVREHMQRLYQRYGVASREDLMAKFVK